MVDREELRSVETTGASVTEAIAEGLERLGLELDDVDVEVLVEPSRGVFGLGSRDARVRLTTKPPAGAPAAPAYEAPAPEAVAGRAPATRVAPVVRPSSPAVAVAEPEAESLLEDEGDRAEAARAAMLELLSLMGIEDAKVEARWTEPAEGETDAFLMLDVKSPTDALIGPRGDTLSALQYVTRLIVGREQGGRARLLVDVNGYKVRRERKLRQLAQRLAQQAVDTDRTVVLEPMFPFERRIVHMTLRDHPEVTTHSIGEGNHRKVTIIPRLE